MNLTELVNNPRAHAWLTAFWCALVPVAWITGWLYSVGFVSLLSLVALILSQGAWWAAAQVARAQADDANVQDVLDAIDS